MGKILIAVDKDLNARILSEILCMEGYETVIADSEYSAYEVFSSSEPFEISYIIIDIQSQRLDGWSVANKIRKLNRKDSYDVKIYAYAESQYKEAFSYAKAQGIDLFLSDPINVDELLEIIGTGGCR